MKERILIKDNGDYCKLIPRGNFWDKEIGSLSNPKVIKKTFPITTYINDYWNLVKAGYVDQTELYKNKVLDPEEYMPKSISPAGRNFLMDLKEAQDEKMFKVFTGERYTWAQILTAEKYFIVKDAFSEQQLKRQIISLCNTLFIPFPKMDNKEEMLEFLEKTYQSFKIFKNQFRNLKVPSVNKIKGESFDDAYDISNPYLSERYDRYKDECIKKGYEYKEEIVYHASPKSNWFSILIGGLTSKPNAVIHGNSYGKGLYLSKTIDYCISYGNTDNKYFVGAFKVLLRRSKRTDEKEIPFHEYDWGYVVTEDAAIKPLELAVI